ncbi:MAG: serpin family protein [Clostridia bacterium]|nr:serpin family protein [Clostridia bacterium]
MKKTVIKIISFLLALSMLTGIFCACAGNTDPVLTKERDKTGSQGSDVTPDNGTGKTNDPIQAKNLMSGFTSSGAPGKDPDNAFVESQMDFALKLFKESVASSDKSVMVSPLSVILALAMTANGADGNTLKEMETVLGKDLTLDILNKYLKNYVASLKSVDGASVKIANSIWFRDDEDEFRVKDAFLQTNADYYNAAAYSAPFDSDTLKDINNWVRENTDGMIDKVLDEIPKDAIMYLINTIAFDAEWAENIPNELIRDDVFTNVNGEDRDVKMLNSVESRYLDDGKATGFIKYYKGGYAFVALLPNEGVDLDDYIASLDAKTVVNTLKNSKYGKVYCAFPQFKSEFDTELSETLIKLGMKDAFNGDKADFSKIGSVNPGENIYISRVIHKTFIEVNNAGTRAAAVTVVEMAKATSIGPEEEKVYSVRLDRPFVYMIIDTQTNIPLFIGEIEDIT